ncbi:MAG: TRAP transporter small permease subunit [Pseudomonadales bacterium]
MRRLVLQLSRCAGALSACALLGLLALIVTGILARALGLDLTGHDAYAGYCLAAAAMLGGAEALRHGDQIRTRALVNLLPPAIARIIGHLARVTGALLGLALAAYLARLGFLSWQFGDVSQSNDATPLWLPQSLVALGAFAFALSLFADCFAPFVESPDRSGANEEHS